MKKNLLLILTILMAAPALAQDVVTLNNGTVINGEIVRQDDRGLTVRTDRNAEVTYYASNIASVNYGPREAASSFWTWDRLSIDARIHVLPDCTAFDWGYSLSADYLLERFGRRSSLSAGLYVSRYNGPRYSVWRTYDDGHYTYSEQLEGVNNESYVMPRITYSCRFGDRFDLHAGLMVGGCYYSFVQKRWNGDERYYSSSNLEFMPFFGAHYYFGQHVGVNFEASAFRCPGENLSLALGVSYRF